jgi:hypothetical protein
MVSSNAPQQFQLVSLQTNPPTIIGTYSTIVAARQAAQGLTAWEIFWSAPKQQRPGPGGVMTAGSPNVTFRKRLERHGGARSDPSYQIDTPNSAGGTTKETGFFGT